MPDSAADTVPLPVRAAVVLVVLQALGLLALTSFLVPLDTLKRWNLKFGFRYEYNGIPNINRRPADFATTLNIVYSRQ